VSNFVIMLPCHCDYIRRKKEGREPHARSEKIHKLHGLKYSSCVHVKAAIALSFRAKLYNRQRFKEKILMKKMYDVAVNPS